MSTLRKAVSYKAPRTLGYIREFTHILSALYWEVVNDASFEIGKRPVKSELQEIRSALARINAGTFGYCARCDCEIAHDRLIRLPYARNCFPCQIQEEQESAEHPGAFRAHSGRLAARSSSPARSS